MKKIIAILLALLVASLIALAFPIGGRAAEGYGYAYGYATIESEATENVTANITDNITPFKSVSDIRDYVRSTGIPDRQYIRTEYDCDDFARDLAEQARIDGKEIGLFLIMRYKDNRLSGLHMTNFAIRGNYAYEVSAQTGNVKPLGGMEVKID